MPKLDGDPHGLGHGIVRSAAYAVAASVILAVGMASTGKIVLTGPAAVASPARR